MAFIFMPLLSLKDCKGTNSFSSFLSDTYDPFLGEFIILINTSNNVINSTTFIKSYLLLCTDKNVQIAYQLTNKS